MSLPDINVILAQMAEMQKQLNDLQSLKKDVKEIKEISSIGEDIAKEVAEEVNQLRENGVSIPHLEKQAEDILFPIPGKLALVPSLGLEPSSF